MEYTPYVAAKVINAQLKKDGFVHTIPPQMMYNYTSQRVLSGKEPFIKCHKGSDGKTYINDVDLMTWYKAYTTKKVNNGVVVHPEVQYASARAFVAANNK